MKIRHSLLTPIILAAAIGCSDSTGIEPDQIAGTWTATQVVFTSLTNSSVTIDWIALGGTFTLTIRSDGTFTAVTRDPDGTTDTDVGDINVAGTVLTIADSGSGSPTAFVAVRNGDSMTLTTTDEEIDFDGDDADDPASLRIVLRR